MNSARLPAGRSLLTTSTSGMRATPATGAMLFAKSNGSDGSNEALIAFAVEVSSSVCPSGGEAITAWVPILLPAPGLFSTMKGWPSRSDRRWQTKREHVGGAARGVGDDPAHGIRWVSLLSPRRRHEADDKRHSEAR